MQGLVEERADHARDGLDEGRLELGELLDRDPVHIDHGRVVIRGDDLRAYVDALERIADRAPGRRRPARPRAQGEWAFLTEG